MTSTTARVAAVSALPLGSVLTDAVLAGATVLAVEDAADFDESGGVVIVGGVEVVTFASADDEAGLLVLASPLVDGFEEGTRVELWDQTAGVRVVETIAQVLVEGESQVGDSLEAVVDHALIPFLPEGIRGTDVETGLVGEAVAIEWRGSELVVVNILGQAPVMDGSMIDPDTLPPGGGVTPEVPLTPGAPTIAGGIGSLLVRWTAVVHPNPVTYRVYASDVYPVVMGPETFIGEVTGTLFTVKRLPKPDVEADTPYTELSYETDYYVGIQAVDSFDDAFASPLGPEAIGSPVQVTGGDIAVNSVATEQLTAGAVRAENLAAELVLASSIKTAEAGQRVEFDTNGMRLHAPDDSVLINLPTVEGEDPSFRGRIQADGLTVREGATFYSPLNEFARGSVISLGEQVAPPVAGPIPTMSWPAISLSRAERTSGLGTFGLDPSRVNSVYYYAASNTAYILQNGGGGTRIWYYNPTTSGIKNVYDLPVGFDVTSMVILSDGQFKILYQYNGNWWILDYAQSGDRTTRYLTQNPDSRPMLTHDGDDLWVVETQTGGTTRFQQITLNTAGNAIVNTTVTTSGLGVVSANPCVAYRGPADFGGSAARWVLSYPSTGDYRVFASNGAYNNTLNWPSPVAKVGGYWNPNDSKFYTLGGDGRIYAHSDLTWTDPVLDTWHVGQSFFKAGSSMETALGTVTSFTMKKRARVILTVAEVPYSGETEDPDAWRMYGKRGAPPVTDRSDMHEMFLGWYYNTALDVGAVPPLTGPVPLVFGTFPGGTPARMRSGRSMPSNPSQSVFEVRGDGSGRWGPLEFSGTGELLPVIPWTSTGIVAASGITLSGVEYMVDAFGKVSWRGELYGDTPSQNDIILTVPSAIAPLSRSAYQVTGLNGTIVFFVGQYGGSGTSDLSQIRYRRVEAGSWSGVSNTALSLVQLSWYIS